MRRFALLLLAAPLGCSSPAPTTPAGPAPSAAATVGKPAPAGGVAGLAAGDELQPAVCVVGTGSKGASDGLALARTHISARADAPRKVTFVDAPAAEEADLAAAWRACVAADAAVVLGSMEPGLTIPLLPMMAGSSALLVVPQMDMGAAAEGLRAVVVGQGPEEMGRVAAADATERGAKTAAVLAVAGTFGDGLAQAFTEAFTAAGGTATVSGGLADGAEGWAAAATAAGASSDALFVVGPPAAAEAVTSKLGSEGLAKTSVWLIDWGMQPEVIAATPKAARHRIHAVAPRPAFGQFEKLYLEQHGSVPPTEAGLAYDAAMLAATAVEQAPTLRGADLLAALTGTPQRSAFGDGPLLETPAGFVFAEPRRVVFEPVEGTWQTALKE